MTKDVSRPVKHGRLRGFGPAAVMVAAELSGLAAGPSIATAAQTDVVRATDSAAKPGPPQYFTGRVSVTELVKPTPPGRASVGLVAFAPGARSNWHRHPAGQTLYVTEGCGWTQREGGPVERICKGDTVYVPAGVKHWHGATATTPMSHLAITEALGGHNVDWLEPVSDAQYRGPTE